MQRAGFGRLRIAPPAIVLARQNRCAGAREQPPLRLRPGFRAPPRAGSPTAAVRNEFSGDINGLNGPIRSAKGAFLLASIARFLYRVVCLACDRPPGRNSGWALDPENAGPRTRSEGEDRFFEQIMLEQR